MPHGGIGAGIIGGRQHFSRIFDGVRIEPINSSLFKNVELMGRFPALFAYPDLPKIVTIPRSSFLRRLPGGKPL